MAETEQQEKDPAHEAIVDHRLAELVVRFGERFNDDQRAKVRDHISKSIEIAKTLRSASLTNADEPEIVFEPYRSETTVR
jgi:hypothetical protein